jgi:hypothetical protein
VARRSLTDLLPALTHVAHLLSRLTRMLVLLTWFVVTIMCFLLKAKRRA